MLRDDVNTDALGRRVILPSSHTGGDRFMQQLYQDSMAIVRFLGKPSLFLTFTANPKWIEIKQELLPGQSATDRPDLVARVFHMKQQLLLRELKESQIFGRYKGAVWTIEYQKRGLPHMHLLLFLHPDDNFHTTERIDQIISAELPLPTSPYANELLDIIGGSMTHGPCGRDFPRAPCMVATSLGSLPACSKHYPREFQSETLLQENGYPLYRRRDNGITVPNSARTFNFDNRWVVPHSPYLCLRYKAHINVEVCASVHAIKYIHKYIYKGSDQATLHVDSENDEIKQYLQVMPSILYIRININIYRVVISVQQKVFGDCLSLKPMRNFRLLSH